jgi:ribonuclease HI
LSSSSRVILYTDGACSPNPGLGGWAAILISPGHGDRKREITGAEAATTNNRMELMAAIRGLEALKRPCEVELYTDSEYLQKAFTAGWLENWRRNGWRTAGRKPVANADLWVELDRLSQMHKIHWRWVRGHHENELNKRCDELAVEARRKLKETINGQN